MTAITRDSGDLPSLTSQCDQRVNLRYPARGHVTGGKADGCGSGFWGGQRPSLAHYVTGMGPMDGATAAGGRSCCNPPDAVHNHFLLVHSDAPAKYARMRNPAAASRGGVLAEYRVQAVLRQVRLANMPGEGPTLGSNRYSPEQGELVEQ